MRVVIHDFGGYPFTLQLARSLAMRGHAVLYLYSAGVITPKGWMVRRSDDPRSFAIDGVVIGGGGGTRRAGIRRLLEERRYGAALRKEILRWKPDVVLSANTPLDAQAAALDASHQCGARFVFWMQDHYSAAVRKLLGRHSTLAGGVAGVRYGRLERRLLRESDAVIAASERFRPTILAWGVPARRVQVIPNWAPLDDGIGTVPRQNGWAREHRLEAVPVLAYSGTLGRKHNPALLLSLAEACPEAQVLVVAEGVGAVWLDERKSQYPNLQVLPLQPADRLAEVLATGDILVALLESDASEFSEPSKVLTYLAAGRPILAAIPVTNQAAKTILDANAGLVVDPSDRVGFCEAARTLLANPQARQSAARSGRAYAADRFDIRAIADRFEAILDPSVGHTGGTTASTAPRQADA